MRRERSLVSHLDDIFRGYTREIDDNRIRGIVENQAFITGGAIASLLLGEEPHDYDVYFKTKEACLEVMRYYTRHHEEIEVLNMNDRVMLSFPEEIAGGFRNVPDLERTLEARQAFIYQPVFFSPNAITLNSGSRKIQLVFRFYGEPADIHEYYDYEHCKCYYMPSTKGLVIPAASRASIQTMELKYTGSLYPLASIIRSRKFIRRGWAINAGQYVKMALQLQEHDLTNHMTLEDQLGGVDMELFETVIAEIRRQHNAGRELNPAFVCHLIDDLFIEPELERGFDPLEPPEEDDGPRTLRDIVNRLRR